jgi:cold shock CspA family protein
MSDVVVTGTVIRFDEVRGYGFAAPDVGGEDVFIHANDLLVDKSQITPGAKIEFIIEQRDRGLKASKVRIAGQPPPVSTSASHRAAIPDEDGLCDILSMPQFNAELTEILLRAAPGMTVEQVRRIRQRLAEFARHHGWIDR